MNDKVLPALKGFQIVGASTFMIATAFVQAMDFSTDIKFIDEVFDEIESRDRAASTTERIMQRNAEHAVRLSEEPLTTVLCLVEPAKKQTLSRTPGDGIRLVFNAFPGNASFLSRSFWVEDVDWKRPENDNRKLARFISIRDKNDATHTSVILDVTAVKILEKRV